MHVLARSVDGDILVDHHLAAELHVTGFQPDGEVVVEPRIGGVHGILQVVERAQQSGAAEQLHRIVEIQRRAAELQHLDAAERVIALVDAAEPGRLLDRVERGNEAVRIGRGRERVVRARVVISRDVRDRLRAALQRVVAAAAVQRVVAADARERIAGEVAGDDIVRAVAGHIDRRGAVERDVGRRAEHEIDIGRTGRSAERQIVDIDGDRALAAIVLRGEVDDVARKRIGERIIDLRIALQDRAGIRQRQLRSGPLHQLDRVVVDGLELDIVDRQAAEHVDVGEPQIAVAAGHARDEIGAVVARLGEHPVAGWIVEKFIATSSAPFSPS